MKSVLPWLLLLALPAAGVAGAERRADHVVLVSVDGLRPEFYLDPLWPAPMMQQMRREGAHARGVRGVFPSVTYAAHTTIVTGALPARHGVFYNEPFEAGGQTGRWYWHAEAIRVPALWDLARAAGLKTASLSWPASAGAPIDWNLPEIWSLDPAVDDIAALRAASRPPGLWEELEREATGRLTLANFTYGAITRDDRVGLAAAYLLETHRPNLLLVHLFETDDLQHEEGREGPTVPRALAAADRAISQIVEAAERAGILERTAFVVTGDHGFVDLHSQLAPNVWLVEAGLMEARPDRGDWRATFHTTAASAFLHLADPADREAAERVRAILEGQPPGVRKLYRILERDDLERLGAAPEAALGLALRPGVDATADASPPALRRRTGATHGYVSDFDEIYTGFLGWGAGFRRGAAVGSLDMVDIAPVVAELLALDLEAPDGVLPAGLLEPAAGGE